MSFISNLLSFSHNLNFLSFFLYRLNKNIKVANIFRAIRLYLYNKELSIWEGGNEMPLELVKEYLEVDQEVKRFTTQTMIEESVVVPDYKPDMEKILSVRGNIHVNNKVVEGNKFYVEGVVDCHIMYQTQEEGAKLQQISVDVPFSHWIEVENEGDIQSIIQTNIEYIDHQLLNTRKLDIRGVIGIQGKLVKKEQYPLLINIKGLEDMQMLRNWVKVTTVADKVNDQSMVKDQIDLGENMPAIVEIIKAQAKVLEKEIKLGDDRIMVNGSIEVEILYIGEEDGNQTIEYVQHEMPLAHFVESPGIHPDMQYQLSFNVEDILTHMNADDEGKFSLMDVEVLVGMTGTLYETHEIESIVDAYSPSIKTALQTEKIFAHEMIDNLMAQATVKGKIETPIEKEEIENILSVGGKVKVSDAQRVEDKWIIEGVVDTEVLYKVVAEGENYESAQAEIPFQHEFHVEEVADVFGDVFTNIRHMSYQVVGPNEIEVKMVLDIQSQLFKPVTVYAISEIEELPLEEEEESKDAKINVYFKQPSDSLWEIAKRYGVTIEDVLKQNDIKDQDQIPNYAPIIISKKSQYMLK